MSEKTKSKKIFIIVGITGGLLLAFLACITIALIGIVMLIAIGKKTEQVVGANISNGDFDTSIKAQYDYEVNEMLNKNSNSVSRSDYDDGYYILESSNTQLGKDTFDITYCCYDGYIYQKEK